MFALVSFSCSAKEWLLFAFHTPYQCDADEQIVQSKPFMSAQAGVVAHNDRQGHQGHEENIRDDKRLPLSMWMVVIGLRPAR